MFCCVRLCLDFALECVHVNTLVHVCTCTCMSLIILHLFVLLLCERTLTIFSKHNIWYEFSMNMMCFHCLIQIIILFLIIDLRKDRIGQL